MEYNDTEQHSLDWFRNRLGFFTASRIADLLVSGRGKEATFGDTAMTLIYQVAAERSLNPAFVDDDAMFKYFLETTNVQTRAMAYGTEQEANARAVYAAKRGVEVTEMGSVAHPTIPWLSASPDGFIEAENVGLEFKCPTLPVYMRYRTEIHDNETLKAANKKYYYQCQAQMMCCGFDAVDFTPYCEFLADPIHIVRILPDKDAFWLIEDRVRRANELIDNILKG